MHLLTTFVVVFGFYTLTCTANSECQQGETGVYSPYIYIPDGPECADLVTGSVEGLYYEPFLQECQRWMGGDVPDYVSHYMVNYCEKFENGTTVFSAYICCLGEVSDYRCISCTGAADQYECAFSGTIEICEPGEICQATETTSGPRGDSSWEKSCVPSANCSSDLDTCDKWAGDADWVTCCNTSFCNYEVPEAEVDLWQCPCASSPCVNGGTCVRVSGTVGSYSCVCPPEYTGKRCGVLIGPCYPSPCDNEGACTLDGDSYLCDCGAGWSGDNCTEAMPLCAENSDYCLNGGTCFDHGEYGLRCLCTSDFVGSRCEMPTLQCKYSSSYFLSHRLWTSDFTTTDCSSEIIDERLNGDLTEANFLEECRKRLGPPGGPLFENNVDGDVNELESRSYGICKKGDTHGQFKRDVCCPSCYSLPCQNNGWCMQADDGDYICQCRFGWEGKNCEYKSSICLIQGDPHYTTYDGAVMHFQGKCVYDLSSTDQEFSGIPFHIITENENRPPLEGVTWIRSIFVYVFDHEIQLNKRGMVKVDGRPVHPDVEYDGFRLMENGRFVRLETDFGLVVEYDGRWTGLVKVPTEYADNLHGICGDFDGNPSNDFVSSDGEDLINDPDRDNAVGDSWLIPGNGLPECRNRLRKSTKSSMPDCLDIEAIISSNAHCGLISDATGPFSRCITDPVIDTQGDFDSCAYDVCANRHSEESMKMSACGSLEALAVRCESAGHVASWRDEAACPLECPAGQVYKSSTSACHATCRLPDATRQCHLPNRESCVCPEGTLMHNGTCVMPSDCGCMDPYGNAFEIGDTWLSSDCSQEYVCTVCDDCVLPVGKMTGYSHACDAPYTQCDVKSVGIGICNTASAWMPQIKIDGQQMTNGSTLSVAVGQSYDVEITVPDTATLAADITLYKMVDSVPDHHGNCDAARACHATVDITDDDIIAEHVLIGSHVDFGKFKAELDLSCEVRSNAMMVKQSFLYLMLTIVASLVQIM